MIGDEMRRRTPPRKWKRPGAPRHSRSSPNASTAAAMAPEPDEPGLGDFRGQRKSRSSLIQTPNRAQAQRRLRRQRLEIDRHHGLGDDLDRRLAGEAV
jgi:hypothetical protein